MKKLISIAIVLVLCLAFFACGESTGTKGGAITLKLIENLSEYVVVRGETSSKDETMLATKLRKAINDATGASVGVKTDYYNNTHEILVGVTKRQQTLDTLEGLRYYDYTIKKIGNKIVVVGGSDEALAKAVELFEKQFIDAEKKTIKIPSGDGYTYIGTYAFDKMTIDGVDLGEFKVVNNSLEDAKAFSKKFCELCGTAVDVYEDEMINDEHYIILDGTELIEHKYSIKVEDGNLIIRGSAHSLDDAIAYFENNMAKSDNKTVELTSADNYEGSTGKKETYTKDQLAKVIQQIYDDPNIMAIGEEVQGKDAYAIENCINKFYEATGEMPGIMGIDLACYGIDLTRIDDIKLSSYICDLVDYVSAGGMITASAHWANPSQTDPDRVRGNFGRTNTLEAYEKAFTDLLTEGTEYNDFFKAELEINARFFKALEENGISIIWRPLHEANGGWFWFCTRQQSFTLDAKYVINIWHYVYDYFENECGLTNLYWCYGPNYSPNINDNPDSTMSTTYLYPGDEYCNMVGVDWYTSGNMEITNGDNYLRLVDHARKPGAITEFGPSGSILADTVEEQPKLYTSMDMYGNLYELVKEGYSFVYLLTWGGKWGIPAMSRGDELMQTDLCIGQAEVKAMFDALK